MQNPLNNGCKPNEHYSKSQASTLLGISRPTLDAYIRQGKIKICLHRVSDSLRIKGTELIKYYNSIS
jgi:predicted site-specific integrase-resolvase